MKIMQLHQIPTDWELRQDSVLDQLADLRIIAYRLGFHDAADAIGQLFSTGKVKRIKYGCHVDLEPGASADPDCVIDHDDYGSCVYAKHGMRREQCEYWRVVRPEDDQ